MSFPKKPTLPATTIFVLLVSMGLAASGAEVPKWVAPTSANSIANPLAGKQEAANAGKALFAGTCMPCHGVAGKGDGPAAVALNPRPANLSDPALTGQSDGAIFWKISEGHLAMPPWKQVLSETQRWQLVNFIRVLSGKGLGKSSPAAPAKTAATGPAAADAAPAGKAPPATVPLPGSPGAPTDAALVGSATSPGGASSAPGGFVTQAEYDKLKAEHEELKQEVAQIKAQLGLPGAAPAGKAGEAGAGSAPTTGLLPELAADVADLKVKVNETQPGTTQFLLAGYGSTTLTVQQHQDPFFTATLNPILLWKVSDRLLFEGELEMELEDGATTTALEMAQMSYIISDHFTLGAGKFLTPMNYFVERQHMAWVNKLPDKPLAVYDGLLPESLLGAQLRGVFPAGSTRIEFAAFVANAPKLVTSPDDISGLGTLDFDNFANAGGHYAFGGHVGFIPIHQLEVGYGVQGSKVGDERDSSVRALLHSVDFNYIDDFESLKGQVALRAQWVWSDVGNMTYEANPDLGYGPQNFSNKRSGGYAQVSYRPSKLDGFFKDVEAVFRFDRLNQANTPVGFDEQRWTIGLNYWFSPSVVMKTAYEIDDKNHDGLNQNAFMLQFAFGF